MANQSLLCNWPRKLPNSAKQGKIMAITPFKVIQGHQFWYQSKAHMRLPIVVNTNLPHILHRFQVMADYMSNFP